MFRQVRHGLIALAVATPIVAIPVLLQEAAHAHNRGSLANKASTPRPGRMVSNHGRSQRQVVTSLDDVANAIHSGEATHGRVHIRTPVAEDAPQNGGLLPQFRAHFLAQQPGGAAHWQFGHSGVLDVTKENSRLVYRDARTGRRIVGYVGQPFLLELNPAR